ncbi:hypothetical protein C8R46DRAFT_1272996 [Mycena filopes]|nr:hypothetical protein C8R46DRAFT_1272996 [Mycena filopes]
MASRIVSVFGATGYQGSAVVTALLKSGTFTPRAISRDPASEASQALRARGVEVVQGDSFDRASLVRALAGSEAVFAVTLPTFVPGKDEVVQGRNMVDAAKEVGVKFFVFTALPSIKAASNGKYSDCIQYEDKVAVQAYLQASGLAHATLHLPCFLENFWKTGHLKKTAPGKYTLGVPNYPPTSRQSFLWVERDIPSAVLALLNSYTDASKPNVNGKVYPVVTANMTYPELAAKTAQVLGAEVTYTNLGPTGMQRVDDMFAFQAETNGLYTTPIPNPDLVALGMKFSTVEEFLEEEVKARYAA